MLPCPATQQHWIKVNVCKPTEVLMENEAIKRSSTPKVLTTEGGTGWPKPFTCLSSYTSPEWVSFCNACSNISIAGAWIPLIRLTTGYNPAKIKSYGSHVFLWRYLCNKATIEVSFVSFGICERIFFSFSISTLAWSPASADMKRCPLTETVRATNWISCCLHGRRVKSLRNTEASELKLLLKGKTISAYPQKFPPLLAKAHWDSMEWP